MRKLSMPKRMLSGAFAAALACTMCPLASGVAPDTAHATETGGEVNVREVVPINVTAPVAVIFGGQGYDVSNPQQSITTTTTFSNAGTQPIYVSKLECRDTEAGDAGKILQKTGSTELIDQRMFSMYPSAHEDRVVSFGINPDKSTDLQAGDIGSKFFIDGGQALDCTFRLNLSNSSEVENASLKVAVSADAAEGQKITENPSLRPIAKVTYTFASYPTVTDADPSSLDFYVKDTMTGKVFDLTTVNSNANSISSAQAASPYYELYSSYAKDAEEKLYECRMNMTEVDASTKSHHVRILGLNSRSLAITDAETGAVSEDAAKVGITFQIDDGIGGYPFCAFASDTADGYAEANKTGAANAFSTSYLRAIMNPGTSSFFGSETSGKSDDDCIWNRLPEELRACVVPMYHVRQENSNREVEVDGISQIQYSSVNASRSDYLSICGGLPSPEGFSKLVSLKDYYIKNNLTCSRGNGCGLYAYPAISLIGDIWGDNHPVGAGKLTLSFVMNGQSNILANGGHQHCEWTLSGIFGVKNISPIFSLGSTSSSEDLENQMS